MDSVFYWIQRVGVGLHEALPINCDELAIVHSIVGPTTEQYRDRGRDRLRVRKLRQWQEKCHQSSPAGAMVHGPS